MAAMAAMAAAGVGRRASIIHSADNQKSWKHTFMRRVVPEEQQRPGGGVTEQSGLRRRL